MPESCSADSTAPRPPAAKRLKHSECSCVRCGVGANADFSNFKPLEDAKGRIIQCSIGCNPCEAFAAAKGTSVTELVAAEKDKPTKAKHASQQNLFENHTSDPSARSYKAESVFYRVATESRLEERFEFTSRTEFRNERGMWPEDAKLIQARVLNSKGEEVSGIVTEIPGAKPVLVVSTAKQFVHHVPKMSPDEHLFDEQASEHWSREVSEFQRHLGQACGAKYKTKKKSFEVYSQDKVDQMLREAVEAKKAKSSHADSGLAELRGHAACVEQGAEQSGNDSDSDAGTAAADEEASGTPAAQVTPAKSPRMQPQPPLASPLKADSQAPDAPAKSVWASRRSQSFSQASTRASSPSVASTKGSAPSVLGEACQDDGEARVKPPSYWMRTMTTALAFSSKNINKQIGWMEACQRRVATSDPTQALSHETNQTLRALYLGEGLQLCMLQRRTGFVAFVASLF